MKTTVVLIVGMHRSGTSLLAKLLGEMGVNFGSDLLKGDGSNPYGHFEDKILMNINEDLLDVSGGSWDAPPSREVLNKNWPRYEDKVKKQIQQLKNSKSVLGLKEPRISLLVDNYASIIENCKIIYIRRDCSAVASSIQKRDAINLNYGIKLCEYYNLEIRKSLEKINGELFTIDYEDLLDNKEQTLQRISKFIGFELGSDEIKQIALGILEKKKINLDAQKFSRFNLYLKAIKRPDLAYFYIQNRFKRFFLRRKWNK